jgi:hypothetical protein
LSDIINPTFTVTAASTVTLPIYYIGNQGDVTVVGDTNPMIEGTHWAEVVDSNNIGNSVIIYNMNGNTTVTVTVLDYVYFTRLSFADPWVPQPTTYESIASFIVDTLGGANLWRRNNGRAGLNFAWFHRSPRYHLVDPAASNIIDMFVITKGYFTQLKRALLDPTAVIPTPPTPLELRTSYATILQNKMVSDTVVMHSGDFKLLFGPRAIPELQANILVIRSPNSTITDNQIKSTIVTTVQNFFDISSWEIGETFYWSELSAAIHASLPVDISSVTLVPTLSTNHFGDMFEVLAREDEIFYVDISVDQVQLVTSYNSTNLRTCSS